MNIVAIVACSENNIIGNHNKLPWHLPNDLKRFKKLTLRKPIIMGRKTYESIGKPLKNRYNIVISKTLKEEDNDCFTVQKSPEDAMKKLRSFNKDVEIFIIGGENIYNAFKNNISKIYYTKVHAKIEGDASFIHWNKQDWECVYKKKNNADGQHRFNFTFEEWVRKQ